MQWQRRWSIWAIFAIASGLKRDEIQPTATWRHGLRVNFNSYCIFIHQNFDQKISFGKGGDKHQKLHEKNLISSSASLNDVVFFSFLPKKSVEQFPMSQPLTPLYVKKVVNLEISVRQWQEEKGHSKLTKIEVKENIWKPWKSLATIFYRLVRGLSSSKTTISSKVVVFQWKYHLEVQNVMGFLPAEKTSWMIPNIRGWFQHAASSLQRKYGTGRSARNLPLFVGWTTRWVPLLVINGVMGPIYQNGLTKHG